MEDLNINIEQIKNALEQKPGQGLVLYTSTQVTQQLITELAKHGVTPLNNRYNSWESI